MFDMDIGGFYIILMNNQTVIDTIVKYSKDCIVMRFVKKHLEKSLFLVKRLPIPFDLPSANTLKIVIEELNMRIDERESDVGKLLIPLFEGKDFGHNNSKKHSLTLQEIRDGYIMLDREEYVILLKNITKLDFSYSAGVLYKIGSGIRKEDLDAIIQSNDSIIADDLLNLIINKKTAYEYLE